MTLNPLSISPDASVDEAACLMQAHKISALPVVERGQVAGILTTTGILSAFVDMSGAAEPTTRLVLHLSDGRGVESKIRQIVHGCHADLKWMHRQGPRLSLRLKARDVDEVVTALEAAGLCVAAVIASNEARAAARGQAKVAKRSASKERRSTSVNS